jgi:hypothetical protein
MECLLGKTSIFTKDLECFERKGAQLMGHVVSILEPLRPLASRLKEVTDQCSEWSILMLKFGKWISFYPITQIRFGIEFITRLI